MSKHALIAALLLVPALGFAAQNVAGTKGPRAARPFNKADTDGNGVLSRAEFAKAMPHLAGRFDSVDASKDGQISRSELNAWNQARRGERQARAAERFRHADADGDGAISRAEAEKHAPRLANKFGRIDSDRDGRLSQDELRAYRETKRSRKDHAQAGAWGRASGAAAPSAGAQISRASSVSASDSRMVVVKGR